MSGPGMTRLRQKRAAARKQAEMQAFLERMARSCVPGPILTCVAATFLAAGMTQHDIRQAINGSRQQENRHG